MRKFSATTGIALLVVSASAAANEGLYLGPSVSKYFLDSERTINGADESLVVSANLGYRFSPFWALEAGYGEDLFGDQLETTKFDAYFWLADDSQGIAPYIVAGVSQFERDDNPNLWEDEDDTQQFDLGIGVSRMVDDHWDYRADVRAHQKIGGGESGTTDFSLNFAVNYYFNAPEPEPEPVAEQAPPPKPAPEPEPEPDTRTITVELRVLFEFDKAVVREIYGDELEAVANAMKEHDDIDLVLEGHTDAIGTDSYNKDLSQRRANAVKTELAKQYGLAPDRISTVGYGETQPVADNSTAEGREKNRRVIGELTFEEVVTD